MYLYHVLLKPLHDLRKMVVVIVCCIHHLAFVVKDYYIISNLVLYLLIVIRHGYIYHRHYHPPSEFLCYSLFKVNL